jgi:hypothetical protein
MSDMLAKINGEVSFWQYPDSMGMDDLLTSCADMVEAEESRMKDRERAVKEHEERDRDLGKKVKPKSA